MRDCRLETPERADADLITSEVLCQLSYVGAGAKSSGGIGAGSTSAAAIRLPL
jgi:hypothetical protein